jgi:ribosomal protein S19
LQQNFKNERGTKVAKETKAEKQLREALAILPEIVAATTASETGFTYTDFLIHSPLIGLELVEINEGIVNEAGAVATRATTKGIEKVMSETVNTAVATEVATPGFVIENIALAPNKRGGRTGKSVYPFEALEVGQSFFVPATAKHPEPAKSLASTVSSAMKRFDVPKMLEDGVTQATKEITVPKTGEKRTVLATVHTRVFGLRPDEVNGIKGARIGRTA